MPGTVRTGDHHQVAQVLSNRPPQASQRADVGEASDRHPRIVAPSAVSDRADALKDMGFRALSRVMCALPERSSGRVGCSGPRAANLGRGQRAR